VSLKNRRQIQTISRPISLVLYRRILLKTLVSVPCGSCYKHHYLPTEYSPIRVSLSLALSVTTLVLVHIAK